MHVPYLTYGIGPSGDAWHISEADRGKTNLRCPYCADQLVARKGLQLEHHFAHATKSCQQQSTFPWLQPPASGYPAISITAYYEEFQELLAERQKNYERNLHQLSDRAISAKRKLQWAADWLAAQGPLGRHLSAELDLLIRGQRRSVPALESFRSTQTAAYYRLGRRGPKWIPLEKLDAAQLPQD